MLPLWRSFLARRWGFPVCVAWGQYLSSQRLQAPMFLFVKDKHFLFCRPYLSWTNHRCFTAAGGRAARRCRGCLACLARLNLFVYLVGSIRGMCSVYQSWSIDWRAQSCCQRRQLWRIRLLKRVLVSPKLVSAWWDEVISQTRVLLRSYLNKSSIL